MTWTIFSAVQGGICSSKQKKTAIHSTTKPNFLTCLTKGEWCKKNLSKNIIKWSNLKTLNPSDLFEEASLLRVLDKRILNVTTIVSFIFTGKCFLLSLFTPTPLVSQYRAYISNVLAQFEFIGVAFSILTSHQLRLSRMKIKLAQSTLVEKDPLMQTRNKAMHFFWWHSVKFAIVLCLWFCFEFCDSQLGFAILFWGFVIMFWVFCSFFFPIGHRIQLSLLSGRS